MRVSCLVLVLGACACWAVELPRSDEKAEVFLPDYGAELRAFNHPEEHPISWHQFLLNTGYGEGRGGPSRQPGKFFDQNWILCD